jgi:hypothetical protein
MSETNGTATLADSRLAILPSGVRIVRLGPGDEGWLEEYQRILLIAAGDFLVRSGTLGTPEGVVARLRLGVGDPSQAVWLVLDPSYRLIGFSLLALSCPFGGPLVSGTLAVYLYPRKRHARVFPELVRRMVAWSREQGAEHCYFDSRRHRPRAWRRIGARAISTNYEVDVKEAH